MGKGLRKSPGLSWIDLNGKVYSFCASDKTHLCSSIIYEVLGSLSRELKESPCFDSMAWDFCVVCV
ncbi:putative pentatricopeptide repeat-containing protein [Platanthera guangdongensis]|uniref:Pentatricopeptide repeat-containing protein n=1 Tax=Platanthera guangdongensis TaxID=2320717 RepID=A0ABR2M172_9ASPA